MVISNTEYWGYQSRKEVAYLKNITEMLKGILEGCILQIISRRETYGYEIARQLNLLGFTEIVEGTVYTILLRFEKNGLVDTEKKASKVGPPRKFYTLTEKGTEELQCFWEKWDFLVEKLVRLKEMEDNEAVF